MAFFNTAVTVLQTLVTALGAGLAIWGVINLMEGYGSDNPGAKSQGMKQAIAPMADRLIRIKSGKIQSNEINECVMPIDEIEW